MVKQHGEHCPGCTRQEHAYMTNSANTRIGVGIVGASADRGWGGIAHVPALRALDAFQIRAVSTTRMESANATASRLGADLAFDTHQALVLRPEVDLVVVAVKVPEHKQIVSDALAAGKMVYCEWPLARNLSEAEALEGFARERRLRTVIGLQGGLHPPIRYLRDLVRQGVIGMPLSTSIRAHLTDAMWLGRYDPPFEYMARAENGATLLSIMLGHALQPLAHVLGAFESLSAVVANQRGDGVRLSDGTSLPKDAPDEIVVAGVLEGGIVTSLHYSAGQSAGSAMVWEIQDHRRQSARRDGIGLHPLRRCDHHFAPRQRACPAATGPARICGSRPATRRTRGWCRPPLRPVRRRPPRWNRRCAGLRGRARSSPGARGDHTGR
ncbi:Gfo/Idh/MocA family protein [Rhizobium leguminosarum]|uniref:Gfo/Idh/MocA family protein n=1 Tax=Rhizobium leguminosarum TaxID=384 RepID=UPI0021BBD476|nr:Gfo/Idh/MocA family oxidoreductase [Rhizobium leguminosarum]